MRAASELLAKKEQLQAELDNPGSRYRRRRKDVSLASLGPVVGFRQSWKEYLRGNVVSEQTAQLIRNFLTVCTTYTGEEDEGADDDVHTGKEDATTASHIPFSVKNVHDIIDGMWQKSQRGEHDDDHKISNALVQSVQLGANLWAMQVDSDSAGRSVAKGLCQNAAPHADADPVHEVSQGQLKAASAKLKSHTLEADFETWKLHLFSGKKKPTEQQWQVLDCIYKRCLHEHKDRIHKRQAERRKTFMM